MRTKRGDGGLLRFIITVISGALDMPIAMFIIRFIKGALDIAKSIDFYQNFLVSHSPAIFYVKAKMNQKQ
jgi:hypothetical protein